MNILVEFLAHPPYRMVFMSIITLTVALFIIFFYLKIYPKKKIPYYLILLILSIPPIISIFRVGIYESGDFHYHAGRTFSFYNSLIDGVIFPRWSAEDNAHFGYALFNYVYPFPYYFTSLFYFLGLNLINSVKLFMAIFFLASGMSMYFWLRNFTKPKYALLGAIFYQFAPYHFIILHFRSHIGEVLVFALLPLTFLFITKAVETCRFLWLFLTGITVSFIITSHPAVALVSISILSLYTLVVLAQLNYKKLLSGIVSIMIGLLLSSYYWIPFFIEARPSTSNGSELTLFSITDILYSPWRMGFLFQGPQGEYALILGYAQWIILLLTAILLIIKKKYRKKNIIFFFLTSTFLLFLLLEASRPIWTNIKLLGSFGVTYRIYTVIAFCISTVAAIIINKIKPGKIYYFSLIIIAILTTILNWGNRGTVPDVTDSDIVAEFPYLHAPSNLWQTDRPEKPIEALGGNLEIISETRTSVSHFYTVIKKGDGMVQENTYYFPGWKLYVDGEEREIYYDIDPIPKMMRFHLDKGRHRVKFIFTDTPVRFYSNLLSAVTLGLSGIYLIYDSFKSSSK